MCWLCVAPSLSGLERSRSDREDEGGAERSAAAHGDRGAPPFDGISSMTLAASPCLFSLVSCKRTDGPLARAACASSSCPCSHTSSVSARRACCSRPPWPRPPPHCPRSAGPPPRPHRALLFAIRVPMDRARSPALAPDGLAPGVHAELVCPALAQPASGLDALGHPCHGHPSDPPAPTARRTMSFRSSLLLVLFVLGVDPVAAACDLGDVCNGCAQTDCSWEDVYKRCEQFGASSNTVVRRAGFEPTTPSGIMSAVHHTHR